MNNYILLLISIIGLLTIYKISLDNFIHSNTSYSISFCIVLVIYYLIKNSINILFLNLNPINILFIIGLILLVASIFYSRKNTIIYLKHLYIPIILASIIAVYAGKYAPYVSLTGETDIIKYLGNFTNNQLIFYQFFHSIFDLYSLNSTINTIPLFVNVLIFLFFFLLTDSLYIYSNNNKVWLVGLLSYFIFFISYACLKFPFIYYMWIVFPINVIFNYIDKKQISLIESILLSATYFSIFCLLNNTELSIIFMSLIYLINELSGSINDFKYKYILMISLLPYLFIDFEKNITIIILIMLIVLSILIKLLRLKKITYLIVTLFLFGSILYIHDFNALNIFSLTNQTITIDFFNLESNKIYLIYMYVLLLILCLINFKSFKRFNKQIIMTILIVFNPLILEKTYELFNYIYIIIFLLINPKTISILFSNIYKLANRYGFDNFIIASVILIAFSSSSILYPNIYDNYSYDDNKIHRMAEDELAIYDYIFENNINISGNIISHAPNTKAYIPEINLLNEYYYYTELNDENKVDAPNNLTNIFALREYAEQEYFNQSRDFEKSFDNLKKEKYNHIIFRKDQSIYYKDFYAPLFQLYLDIYDVIYENDTYALLQMK